MLILYGSQTGTSQDVAERLWRDAKSRNVPNLRIDPIDDYEIQQLPNEKLIIFICSTSGQGDEPDNMRRFWRFLCRRNLPQNCLSEIHIAVLGLGDSSYQKFNFAAKKLYRRLLQLGANPLIPLGLADDQHELGYDFVVDSWMKELWTVLEVKFQIMTAQLDNWTPKYLIDWNLIEDFTDTDRISDVFYADLIGSDRVTAIDHFQDTRLIKLSITGSSIDYLPGDVVYIQPRNLDESVREFLELLSHFNPDQQFELAPSDPCFKLPPKLILDRPYTLRKCAESYFDLQSVPRRSFFQLLAQYSPADSLEREKLLEFSSSEGQEEYFSYCTRPRRTTVETMRDFPNAIARVPLEYWFDLIGPIRPRAFSIASCPKVHSEIQILMAVVKYKTRLYAPRLGLCSTWLSRLPLNSKVPVWIGKGTIEFPWTTGDPCILIGPGTGVAPFRSFLHWRLNRGIGENVLFFGCRNERKDYYFENEFDEMANAGILRLFTAFSRDQSSDGRKIYVQHKIRENARLVAEMIVKNGARIFVAGSSKQMPKDVQASLKDVLKEYFTNEGVDNADNYVDLYMIRMEKEKRFQMETWS